MISGYRAYRAEIHQDCQAKAQEDGNHEPDGYDLHCGRKMSPEEGASQFPEPYDHTDR